MDTKKIGERILGILAGGIVVFALVAALIAMVGVLWRAMDWTLGGLG